MVWTNYTFLLPIASHVYSWYSNQGSWLSINSLRTEVDAQMVADTETTVVVLTLSKAKFNREIFKFELASKNWLANIAASWKQ